MRNLYNVLLAKVIIFFKVYKLPDHDLLFNNSNKKIVNPV